MTATIDTSPEAVAALLDGVTPGPWRIQNCASMGHRCTNYYQEIWNDETNILVTTEVTRAHNDGGAKNMRFIAAARELVPALATEIASLTAERDEARAQVAMAYEAAARLCDDTAQEALDESGTCSRTLWTWFHGQSSAIRALTPADAAAALAARDAAMRNEGRRQAAEIARADAQSETGPILRRRLSGSGTPVAASARRRQAIRTAHRILAALEPEGGE